MRAMRPLALSQGCLTGGTQAYCFFVNSGDSGYQADPVLHFYARSLFTPVLPRTIGPYSYRQYETVCATRAGNQSAYGFGKERRGWVLAVAAPLAFLGSIPVGKNLPFLLIARPG